ncbi:uridine phosphorylase 1 isoform X1 [Topomyia yanbarensis]|uniref:uridine phosphorylase 1 isoform X1 n=1 Tax=Topomyia yanbarensis TaxID=2498891 RepID=UPI00273C6F07|nr:uridine phosphorylase 1 isoform X1 [Topomyia yanbarensis]XP_058830395.1 uridine phosphorylase 1 isoform X1 [Topomyia yanbarensis]
MSDRALQNGATRAYENNNHSNNSRSDEDEHDTDSRLDTRYNDGSVKLRNPNIELMDQDILYHLALGSESHDLREMFGDVKFVCMGGTPKRMENFAHFIMDEIGYKLPAGTQLQDISAFSYRYSMYKVGPVLSISHGMGVPSLGILLHEMIKLMYHAKCINPIFIRIGTCGGVGVEGGTVVITEDAVDGLLRSTHELAILGKIVHRPAILDKRLVRELKSLASPDDPYDTITGKTMCTSDFYEGQGRLDGAFCEFSEQDKMDYLEKLRDFGVVNIEMECTIFAALTHHAGIKAAIVCVTLLDRLKGDQVMSPKEVMNEWQQRPQILVSRLIRKHLAQAGHLKSLAAIPSSIKSPRRFKLVQQESEAHE